MKYSKKYCVLVALVCCLKSFSQEVPKGFELMELVKIAETYQTVADLSFTMQYTYADSAQPNNIIEQLSGSYKIHNGKYWNMLDSIEFLQGGLYSLAVYHRDSVIAINNRQEYTSLMQVPMMDSLFRQANVLSMLVDRLDDSTRSINIQFNPQGEYRSYEMQYDPNTYLIRKVKYHIPNTMADSTSSDVICITINFSNYSGAPVSEDYFNEGKFIYQQGGQLLPQPAYADFRLLMGNVGKRP
jgi:hypothetical protein